MHVVSTAGHVDHGKSALVRALTGIEPDRLAEEQARGLTIDLGYAWCTLPSGDEIGIVDVPGHERFISTMLAGAGQSDVVLFVVDANEGWKPQSEEHLQILSLLGARHAVVALTKVDRCDDITAATDAVGVHLQGSPLAGAPIVAVSAKTGVGLPQIRDALATAITAAGEAPDHGRPRVWLDRSFSIKGSGTVVTGTLAGGSIATGDVLEIADGGTARVRQIQTHGTRRDVALPVSRVALNLAGVEVAQVTRGDAAITPGRWQHTRIIDVELRAIAAITARGAFKVHVGSAETDARLTLIDAVDVAPGGVAFARLRLSRALPLQPGDRYVLRDTGRRATIGGGSIVDVAPPRRARERAHALRRRAAALTPGMLAHGMLAHGMLAHAMVADATMADVVLAELGRATPADLERLSGSGARPATAVTAGGHLYDAAWFAGTREALTATLRAHHEAHPLAPGMPRAQVLTATRVSPDVLADLLVADVGIEADGADVRLTEHRPRLAPEHVVLRARLLEDLRDAGARPPARTEVETTYGAALLGALARAGEVIVVGDVVWSSEVIVQARTQIAAAIAERGPLTAAQIKDLLGTTRRFAIPLLEHLDASGFTRRDGDLREIR